MAGDHYSRTSTRRSGAPGPQSRPSPPRPSPPPRKARPGGRPEVAPTAAATRESSLRMWPVTRVATLPPRRPPGKRLTRRPQTVTATPPASPIRPPQGRATPPRCPQPQLVSPIRRPLSLSPGCRRFSASPVPQKPRPPLPSADSGSPSRATVPGSPLLLDTIASAVEAPPRGKSEESDEDVQFLNVTTSTLYRTTGMDDSRLRLDSSFTWDPQSKRASSKETAESADMYVSDSEQKYQDARSAEEPSTARSGATTMMMVLQSPRSAGGEDVVSLFPSEDDLSSACSNDRPSPLDTGFFTRRTASCDSLCESCCTRGRGGGAAGRSASSPRSLREKLQAAAKILIKLRDLPPEHRQVQDLLTAEDKAGQYARALRLLGEPCRWDPRTGDLIDIPS